MNHAIRVFAVFCGLAALAAIAQAQPTDCGAVMQSLLSEAERLIASATSRDRESIRQALSSLEARLSAARDCTTRVSTSTSSPRPSGQTEPSGQTRRPSPVELTEMLNRTHRGPTPRADSGAGNIARVDALHSAIRAAVSGPEINRPAIADAISAFRAR